MQHRANFKPPGAILLIPDDLAASHLDYTIVDIAEQKEITQQHNPWIATYQCIVRMRQCGISSCFSRYWDQYPDRYSTKVRFNIIFTKDWNKSVKATGIYPFVPTAIHERLLMILTVITTTCLWQSSTKSTWKKTKKKAFYPQPNRHSTPTFSKIKCKEEGHQLQSSNTEHRNKGEKEE